MRLWYENWTNNLVDVSQLFINSIDFLFIIFQNINKKNIQNKGKYHKEMEKYEGIVEHSYQAWIFYSKKKTLKYLLN